MTTRKAPYTHADGSNCWTKNCSRGHKKSTDAVTSVKEREANISKLLTPDPTKFEAPKIDVIAPWSEFEKAIAEKRIFAGKHPEYPEIIIMKYSQATVYSSDWDRVTLASRGLIVNTETKEILARPFGKFFNLQENKTPEHLMTGSFRVADKLDGSLGIGYYTPDKKFRISTAGGLGSEQGDWATQFYNQNYAGRWNPNPDLTYHWEIIYSGNQVVVKYDYQDLVLLGAVNKTTGRSVDIDSLNEWKGRRAEQFHNFKTLADVANAPSQDNKEGYVVWFPETDTRVKAKFSDYIQLHRISTGLNRRRIFELLRTPDGKQKLAEYRGIAPEEFVGYIDTTAKDIESQYKNELARIHSVYDNLISSLPKDVDQKTFALAVQSSAAKSDSSHMFKMRQGFGPIEDKIWDSITPEFETGFLGTLIDQDDDV